MEKDILGRNDLDSLKIDWNFHGPGLMEGRCAATGTCDACPRVLQQIKHNGKKIESLTDPIDPKVIWLRYGSLFSD